MPKKEIAPDKKPENLAKTLSVARQIIGILQAAAKSGPSQLEATNLLVMIAAETCYAIESLYFQDSSRPVVERIALKRDFFPATFSNMSGTDGESWPGNVLRKKIQLAPQLLGKGRRRRKDVSDEERSAVSTLRFFIGIFTRALLNDSNNRHDIPQSVKQRYRTATKTDRLRIVVEEFTKWMQHYHQAVVLDEYGQLNAIAERRRKSIQRSEPKADIWRGFSMIVRDQLRPDLE